MTHYVPSTRGLPPATAWDDSHLCAECGWTAGAHDAESGACPAKETQDRREILVHLNVEVPEGDTRSADKIADAIIAALQVGADDDSVRDLVIVAPLAEEI